MMKIQTPGIYREFPVADYFSDPCPQPSLSQSIAKLLIDRSPAHAHLAHPRLGKPIEEDYKPATAIGNAAHALATGRSRDLAIGEWADWRTKEAKTFKASAHDSGHLPILRKHLTSAEEVVLAMGRQLAAAGHAQAFAKSDQCEVVLAWEEDGIWLRTMIDCVADLKIYDLKTSAMNCAPHIVAERPSDLGWDIQAAMFERGLGRLDPGNAGRHDFLFVAQENEAPFALTVVRIGEADLTLGRKKLEVAIEIWRQCITSGQWPAYPADTVTSHPRGWTESQWLEREQTYEARRLGDVTNTVVDRLMAG
jgi:PDDEXK-like domain of unknown function (DUF3799)